MKKLMQAVLILIAVLVVFAVYQVSLFPDQIRDEPFGAAFFPYWLCGLMAFLITLIWIENQKTKDGTLNLAWAKLRRPAFFIVSAMIFALILPAGGFILCALAFLIAGMRICQIQWRTAVIASMFMTTSVYLIFKTLLKVPLPVGSWWENLV